MRGERGAHDFARPINQVEDAGRHTGIMHDLGEQQRAVRRELARLQHDRAASGDCGSDLRRDLIERPVPRCDERADTDRFLGRRGRTVDREEPVSAQDVHRHPDVLRRKRHLGCTRKDDRGTHFRHKRIHEQLRALLDQLEDPAQQRYAFFDGGAREVRERPTGGGHCKINIVGTTRRDFADQLFGGGIHH